MMFHKFSRTGILRKASLLGNTHKSTHTGKRNRTQITTSHRHCVQSEVHRVPHTEASSHEHAWVYTHANTLYQSPNDSSLHWYKPAMHICMHVWVETLTHTHTNSHRREDNPLRHTLFSWRPSQMLMPWQVPFSSREIQSQPGNN